MRIDVREGIYMRPLTRQDAGEVFAVIHKNRHALRTWLPWVDGTDSPEVVEGVIATWHRTYESGTEFVLGIFKDVRYIGNIGLHDMKCSNHSGMIGYWLAPDEQGDGIMTDCVRALAHYGFSALSLNRIYIYCAVGNLKSRAIPERLGFALEGVLQDGELLYGQYFDTAVYGVVRRYWNCVSAHDLYLATPTLAHKEAAMKYRQEHIDHGEGHIHGSGGLIHAGRYEDWLERVTHIQMGTEPGWVKAGTFFAMVRGRIVGTIQVRHTLNDDLLKMGGHIGYGVCPTARRRGYAARMLALALERCPELGISKALVTCDRDNISSVKTILKCGGVLENEWIQTGGNVVQRYWIDTENVYANGRENPASRQQ